MEGDWQCPGYPIKARGLCYSHFGWTLVKSGAAKTLAEPRVANEAWGLCYQSWGDWVLAWEGLVARLSAQGARWAVTKIMGVWVPLPYASFAPEWNDKVPGRYGPPDHHSFLNHESVWGTAKLVKCNYLVAMARGVTVGLCFINLIQCRSALCITIRCIHFFIHSIHYHSIHSFSPSPFHSFFLSITQCM